jgi:hypothetical protein
LRVTREDFFVRVTDDFLPENEARVALIDWLAQSGMIEHDVAVGDLRVERDSAGSLRYSVHLDSLRGGA